MREMSAKTHFHADKREDIHNRAGYQCRRRGTLTPREMGGSHDTEKRKDNRQNGQEVGTCVKRAILQVQEVDSRVCRVNSNYSFSLHLIQFNCSHTLAFPTTGIA